MNDKPTHQPLNWSTNKLAISSTSEMPESQMKGVKLELNYFREQLRLQKQVNLG